MSVHINLFSDKVRAMNQTRSKNLTLSADEARNLYTEIFNLLAKIVDLEAVASNANEMSAAVVEMDGGKFK